MLVDGHSMAFRAFFALPTDNFSTTSGQHTNAVYGFLNMLCSLIQDEEPTHVAVAFDVARETFRNEMFPEYKMQRDKAPAEFSGQVPLIKQVLQEMGVVTLEKDNFEADDIIATLATQARAEDFSTLIVTGDRDSFQLVSPETTVLYPMRGVRNIHRFTPEAVEEKYGLTPVQYPDFAALRGDPSDNLPGIPGVGEKTAQKWIKKYGSLANLLENADEIGGKVGDSLRERVGTVELNRKVTEMVKDLDLPYGPGELELRPASASGIAEFFDRLEFGNQLRDKVMQTFDVSTSVIEESETSQQSVVRVISLDDEPLAQWLDRVSGDPIALYLSDFQLSLAAPANPVLSAGSGDSGGSGDAGGTVDAEENAIEVVEFELGSLADADDQALRKWLSSDAPKMAHDVKALIHQLGGHDIPPSQINGFVHDTMLGGYLLRPSQRSYSLANLYQRHLNRSLAEEEAQLDLLSGNSKADRVVAVAEVAAEIAKQLDGAGLYGVYSELEVPLAPILAQMEITGIAVDTAVLQDLRKEAQQNTDDAVAEARKLVELDDLNLASPKQLQAVLFDQLDMPKTKKTKTGYSTAAKEIETLAATHPHPFLDQLLKFREWQKMKTTVEGLIKSVGEDGRIHTTFNQTVAATGRLSSTEPNLQNIPVRTPFGQRIRQAFVVGQDYAQLLTADYSQIEMRVMAHLSEDAGLIEAYRTGEDLHNYVGSKVFQVPTDQVTPDLRRRVKAMSYGLAYGLSAFGLAQQLDIPQGEARRLREDYFKRFGGVRDYLESVVVQARKDGYTSTLFERRRYLPDLNSDNHTARQMAERAALNSPIQGTAADIIKVAMLRVAARLQREGLKSRMLLQVHDELVLELADGEEQQASELVQQEMGAAIELSVPLEVSVGHGVNWDQAAH